MSNGYLLDTNVVILSLAEPENLSKAALKAIERGPNVISSAVYWELVLKSMKGKLCVGDVQQWWKEALQDLCATALPIRPDHIGWITCLPDIHSDPFDRLLIAQALHEDLCLVTCDGKIPEYVGHLDGLPRELQVIS